MNENQIKEFTKFWLDNGNRNLTKEEKEILKIAIDRSSSMEELLQVIIASLGFEFNQWFLWQHNGNKKSDTPNLTDNWDNWDTTSDKT